jgi:uncharacterized protein YdhG (YjbR/CyaY superfamily)
MDSTMKFKTMDEYLSDVPARARVMMEEIRMAVQEVVPGAEEVISYNMPAFRFHGVLLYFAAHSGHIGFYPGNASLIARFKNELAEFETSKGTIRFSLEKPLPVSLIKRIAAIRAAENLEKSLRKPVSKSQSPRKH